LQNLEQVRSDLTVGMTPQATLESITPFLMDSTHLNPTLPQSIIERDALRIAHSTLHQLKGLFLSLDSDAGVHATSSASATMSTDFMIDADIIIATPQRIVDHLSLTPGFAQSLTTLEFLVIDEADRLMTEGFSDWIGPVLRSQAAPEETHEKVAALYEPVPAPKVSKDFAAARASEQSFDRAVMLAKAMEQSVFPTLTPFSLPVTRRDVARADARPNNANFNGLSGGVPEVPLDPYLLEKCISAPRKRLQKLLFSATFTKHPQHLAQVSLRHPLYFSFASVASSNKALSVAHSLAAEAAVAAMVGNTAKSPSDAEADAESKAKDDSQSLEKESGKSTSDIKMIKLSANEHKYRIPDTLAQYYAFSSFERRALVVAYLIDYFIRNPGASLRPQDNTFTETDAGSKTGKSTREKPRFLIFAGDSESAHRLSRLLELMLYFQVAVGELSSYLPSSKRQAMITDFTKGNLQVLVCSDIASRGLDFPNVNYVINYALPADIENYVHKIGRTARAGATGIAITLVCNPSAKKRFCELVNAKTEAKHRLVEFVLKDHAKKLRLTPLEHYRRRLKYAMDQGYDISTVPKAEDDFSTGNGYPLSLLDCLKDKVIHIAFRDRFANALNALKLVVEGESKGDELLKKTARLRDFVTTAVKQGTTMKEDRRKLALDILDALQQPSTRSAGDDSEDEPEDNSSIKAPARDRHTMQTAPKDQHAAPLSQRGVPASTTASSQDPRMSVPSSSDSSSSSSSSSGSSSSDSSSESETESSDEQAARHVKPRQVEVQKQRESHQLPKSKPTSSRPRSKWSESESSSSDSDSDSDTQAKQLPKGKHPVPSRAMKTTQLNTSTTPTTATKQTSAKSASSSSSSSSSSESSDSTNSSTSDSESDDGSSRAHVARPAVASTSAPAAKPMVAVSELPDIMKKKVTPGQGISLSRSSEAYRTRRW